MARLPRVITIGGVMGTVVAGGLAALALVPAFAQDVAPVASEAAGAIFPQAPAFDPDVLRKFDVTVGDAVSTEVERTDVVTKIAFGHKSLVTVVNTPTGTYSSDALVSPNVRYPGIDVTPRNGNDFATTTLAAPDGTHSWTSFSAGSFTYLTYHFTPAPRRHV